MNLDSTFSVLESVTGKIRNPKPEKRKKPEIRGPKEGRNPKSEAAVLQSQDVVLC